MVKAQLANEQHNEDDIELGEEHLQSLLGDQDLDEIGYEEIVPEEKNEKLPKYIKMNNKEMEENLEEMYELRKQKRE